jgi:hypothetical protein
LQIFSPSYSADEEIEAMKKSLLAVVVGIVLASSLCSCVLPDKELSETLFEVSFYSQMEKATPIVSLRGDRKLFVVRARQEKKAYNYKGNYFDVDRGDMAELKRQALEVYKLGQETVENCTNAVRVRISIKSEKGLRELCVKPGKNAAVDELFDSFNQLITDADDHITWR